MAVSTRKQRNQATNRVHDIEFAAEISTSLISQVRGLQALLAEREEELRDTKQDHARLEDESEGLRERIKELDESENRYKEENWNLETRIHELEAAQRDAADNEKKVAQQLATLLADNTRAQRELDELKASHARLVDDHTASVKQHDIELGTAKRSIAMADSERTTLQRRIDDLTSQNQELAKTVAIQQRERSTERDASPAAGEDNNDTTTDHLTPEESPPVSPVKGTPRHSALETETLKTSLLHAQRTLQSLRTNLHREKTEKLELRRMLQDTRDELERVRSDPNPAPPPLPKKIRKDHREHHIKMRPSQLGVPRAVRTELVVLPSNDPSNDPDWEEVQSDISPSATRTRAGPTDTSDHFETANEAQMSDTSFATANDGAETAEDFHTGAEEHSSGEHSSGDETATVIEHEPRRGRTLYSRNSNRPADNAESWDNDHANQSTASTSDEEDYDAPRTPTASLSAHGVSRMRLRASRSSLASRRLRHMSSVEEAVGSPGGMYGSPYSATGSPAPMANTPGSINSTPRVAGLQQSLFAELGELDEDSDEEVASDGTPARLRSPKMVIPAGHGGSARSTSSNNSIIHSPLTQMGLAPRIVTVDRSTLTEAVTIMPWSEAEAEAEGGHGKGTVLGGPLVRDSRPSSFMSDDAINMDEKLKEFPSPPTSPPRQGLPLIPIVLAPPTPERTTRDIEAGPDAPEQLVEFTVSNIVSVPIEPVATPLPVVDFTVSKVVSMPIEPVALPPVDFTVSNVAALSIDPVAEPETPKPSPVILGLSMLSIEHVTPKMPPTPEPEPAPVFATSAMHAVDITPIELPPPVLPVPAPIVVPKEAPPAFSFSAISMQNVEPVAEPPVEPVVKPLEPLSLSGFHIQHVAPVAEPEVVVEKAVPPPPMEPFSFSAVQVQHVEPVIEEVVLPVVEPFSFSALQSQQVEPVIEKVELPVVEPFSFSKVQVQHVEPVAEPEVALPPLPQFSVSNVLSHHVEPVATPEKPVPTMALSSMLSQHIEPVVVEVPEPEVVPVPVNMSAATQTDEWKPEPAVASAGILSAGAALLGPAAATAVVDDDSVCRSPKRNGFIFPRDFDPVMPQDDDVSSRDLPTTPNKSSLSSALGWSKTKEPSTPIIAEDETRQSPSTSPLTETPESQRPFKEISVNSIAPRHALYSQTQDAADDRDFMSSSSSPQSVIRDESFDTTSRNVGRGYKAESATGSPRKAKNADALQGETAANDFATLPLPLALPISHKAVTEAARTGSVEPMAGEGAPTWRVRTPTGAAREPTFVVQGATPTPKHNSRAAVIGDMRPPSRPASRTNTSQAGASVGAGNGGTISRQTSVSSFASEVDARFNIHDGSDVFGPGGHSHIDPRMIQAITQTMIGEYLWKYTRKPGRSGLSENRHRRYFWIHPYTRMLSWSDHGPTPGSRLEQRAKSIPIEGVRVVTDDNPMPPGLHRKSLIVISPGRTIKFTCPTSHRHEIWFNALSYLLLRNDEVPNDGMTANGEPITREDVDEFNPSFGHRPAAPAQAHRRPPVSLSSYNSRTTRNESPAFDMSMSIPTLTPTPRKKTSVSGTTVTPSTSAGGMTSRSRLSRLGGYWRSSQSLSAQFTSFRGRSTTPSGHRHTNGGAQDSSIYESSEVNDSAEELRAMYEAQDRAADRLENVRACCDGKHDVGMLSHSSRHHRHSHGPSSVMSTPTHSTNKIRA